MDFKALKTILRADMDSIDLDEIDESEEMMEGIPNIEQMIAEGADPQFAMYAMLQSQLMMIAN